MRICLCVILSFIYLTACTSKYPDAPAVLATTSINEIIRKNDTVRLHIYGEDDLSGDYIISTTGNIILPVPGEIHIENLTGKEAAKRISDALHKKKYFMHPQISVTVIKRQPVSVIGEVMQRGEHAYQPDMTVFQAIALAGGYTYRADRGDIILRRKDPETGKFQLYKAKEDTPLLPGDMIEVNERYF